jgi:sec-independent protein translocase protein TatC
MKRTILEHFEELRKRFFISLAAIAVCSIVSYLFIDSIMKFLIKPLKSQLVFTSPGEAFMMYVGVSLVCGIMLSSPVIFYQIWKFVSFALQKKEKRWLLTYVPVSVVLFALGVLFSYYILLPTGLNYLLKFGGSIVKPMITISNYLSFIMVLLLGSGIVFELPLVILFLAKLGMVTPKGLSKNRAYFIFGAVIAAAVITPGTDAFTQLLLAIPIILLYEISIVVARIAT